jgi:hypothetical protein
MSKLIPSREVLDDFVILLKRCASAYRTRSGCGADGNPAFTDDDFGLVSMLRKEVTTRLDTLDFRATYGWPNDLSQALESLRSGKPSSHPPKAQTVNPIKGFRLVRVFNRNTSKVAMVNLDRVIGDLEAAMSAERQAVITPTGGATTGHTRPVPGLSINGNAVTVGGTTYSLEDSQAGFVQALVDKGPGVWVAGPEMGISVQPRPDRVFATLPDPIRTKIESKTGAGYRIRLE